MSTQLQDTSPLASSGQRIFGLDLLRALAIIFVMHSHTGLYVCGKEQTAIATHYFGFIGVELFFVLSGFLIGTILLKMLIQQGANRWQQLRMFWMRRWLRTIPNYYLAFLTVIFCAYKISGYNLLHAPSYHLFWWFGENIVTKPPPFFTVAWSLAIEEWFYLIFPLLALLALLIWRKRPVQAVVAAAVLLIIGCLAARWVLAGHEGYNWPENFRKMVPLRLDGIAVGVLFAAAKMRYADAWRRWRWVLLALGLAILGLATAYFMAMDMMRGASVPLFAVTIFFPLWSFGLAFLLPFFDGLHLPPTKFLYRLTAYIAAISYSLYLYHTTLIMVLDRGGFGKIDPTKEWAMIWGGSILIATVVYYLFERPVLWLRDRIGNPQKGIQV